VAATMRGAVEWPLVQLEFARWRRCRLVPRGTAPELATTIAEGDRGVLSTLIGVVDNLVRQSLCIRSVQRVQPTIRRLYTSRTIARYRKPTQVWSKDDVKNLRAFAKSRLSGTEMAKKLKRTPGDCHRIRPQFHEPRPPESLLAGFSAVTTRLRDPIRPRVRRHPVDRRGPTMLVRHGRCGIRHRIPLASSFRSVIQCEQTRRER